MSLFFIALRHSRGRHRLDNFHVGHIIPSMSFTQAYFCLSLSCIIYLLTESEVCTGIISDQGLTKLAEG